jgi:integral membrane protein (TIGR01906 family)
VRPSSGRSLGIGAVVAVIAVTVTPLLLVDAFRVLARDWLVHHELERDGFPPDRYGLTTAQRVDLALAGLRSIRPGGEGIALLERATLPDGSPAFDSRELRHMGDVRTRLVAAFRLQLVVVAGLVVLAVALARSPRGRRVVPLGLLLGALLTLLIAALLVPVIVLGFDRFFLGFHELLFSGDSWRFGDTDTLLRIYPQRFWEDTARYAAVLVVAQAVVLAAASALWLRRLPREVAA